MDPDFCRILGFSPAPDESDEEFIDRVVSTMGALVTRPITLQNYCDYLLAYAGRAATVEVIEHPEQFRLDFRVYVPFYRAVIGWQRRRLAHRLLERLADVRPVHLLMTVKVERRGIDSGP